MAVDHAAIDAGSVVVPPMKFAIAGASRLKGQIVDVHCDRARLYHWFSRVMETTILRMTGAASSTMGQGCDP